MPLYNCPKCKTRRVKTMPEGHGWAVRCLNGRKPICGNVGPAADTAQKAQVAWDVYCLAEADKIRRQIEQEGIIRSDV